MGAVDILDDFLAAAGLDVDINIGRAIAVRGEKALEKQLRGDGLGIGNAQREAHRGVSGRAAALAQNILAAAKIHQVAHDQEVAGKAQLLDDAQLMPNLFPCRLLNLGRARGVAGFGAAPNLVFEPAHLGMPLRNGKVRQVRGKRVPGKGALASQTHSFSNKLRPVRQKLGHLLARSQPAGTHGMGVRRSSREGFAASQGALGGGEPSLVAGRGRGPCGCDGPQVIVFIQETVPIRVFRDHAARIFENYAVYFYSFEQIIDFC